MEVARSTEGSECLSDWQVIGRSWQDRPNSGAGCIGALLLRLVVGSLVFLVSQDGWLFEPQHSAYKAKSNEKGPCAAAVSFNAAGPYCTPVSEHSPTGRWSEG
jgi:hypothetical protein